MVWSQQAPNNLLEPRSPSPAITPERPTKRQRIPEVENGEEVSVFPGHFPASCEHMFGPLPIPSSTSGMQTFPHNVLFRTADWVNFEISEDKLGYDIVIAYVIRHSGRHIG